MIQVQNEKSNGRWTDAEHERFLLGLHLHGKNWKKIQEMIKTRSGSQIRSHAQKFFLKQQQGGEQVPQSATVSIEKPAVQPQIQVQELLVKQESKQNHEDTSISFFRLHFNKYSQMDFWRQCIEPAHKQQNKNQENLNNQSKVPSSMGQKRPSSFVPCQIRENQWERITKLRKMCES